jgi:NAD(P)H-nitrite reductase large subunit
VTRIGGITTTILGAVGRGTESVDLQAIARGDSEGWRIQPDAMAVETGEQHSRARLLLGANTIVGAVVMGDQSLSRPLQHLIGGQVDISPIRDRLLAEPAELVGTVMEFWNARFT